ncbi:transporter substrate-binding protein [Planotetraspora sp. A-T 1434]|uniref:transporter substrate-binding protein n=1 Tax=Planotetraspora sp. A-T 1434 TaxID=2979219 RepID=UPI0039659F17
MRGPYRQGGATFAEKSTKLIAQDKVATVFGGRTFASRKAMLPVFQKRKVLLWHPCNTRAEELAVHLLHGRDDQPADRPGLDYLKERGNKKCVPSLAATMCSPERPTKSSRRTPRPTGMEVLGEKCTPLGHTEYGTLVSKSPRRSRMRFQHAYGDSDVASFK